MKLIFFFILLLLSQFYWAQSQNVEQVIKYFDTPKIEWQIPLSKKQTTQGIVWQERKSSLASKGIRTFVGYADNQFIGVLSIHQNNLSGNVYFQGENYQISTQKGKIIVRKDETKDSCGTCADGSCQTHEHSQVAKAFSAVNPLIENDLQAINTPETSKSIIPSDGILRIYRLAILTDYSVVANHFNNNIDEVKSFWASTETYLNEIYMRDIGVKFKIVDDNRLIINDISNRKYEPDQSSGSIMSFSSLRINEVLGDEQYDIGISIAIAKESYSGIASFGGVYRLGTKGSAYAQPNHNTIAHELGHMFGASHTFTAGPDGHKTEPELGTSLMSYGQDRDIKNFFSLFSINQIRKDIAEKPWYYSDEKRTKVIGGSPPKWDNIVYGIDTKNKAPIIDRDKIKTKYKLPPYTAFRFIIPATDPDNDALIYWAHQTDPSRRVGKGRSKFYSNKPVENNLIRFEPKYYPNLITKKNTLRPYTMFEAKDTGEFTFWLGVSDADVSEGYINRQHHASRLDVVPVTIEVVPKAKPFRITSIKKTGDGNTAGTKYKLKWDVDENIFDNDSRVRILMSDDFSETWKHIIHPNTENDGEEEIIVPNIELTDEISHGKTLAGRPITSSKGLFRIEVIDHIATATTDGGAVPFNGGFKIKKNAITFDSLPDTYLIVNKNDIPAPHNLTASTTCKRNKGLKIEVTLQKDKTEGNLINRIWEAGDYCGNEAYFSQFIEIKEEETTTTPSDLYHNPTSGDGLKGLVGINTENPKTGSWLTIASHNKGFVITRLTSAQIDALTPQEGMMVFDTEEKCLKIYDGKKWSCFSTPTAP